MSNFFAANGTTVQWGAAVALLISCVALVKVLSRALASSGSCSRSVTLRSVTRASAARAARGRARARAAESVQREDNPDLNIPERPHCEIALDPPCGLQFSNPEAPYSFENEFCAGRYIHFHPPTSSEPAGAGSLDYHNYFKGKKHLWELRVELQFKKAPAPGMDLFFGVELEEYVPTSAAMKRVFGLAVAAIQRAVGGFYHSYGDDPAEVAGEGERPTSVLPLRTFDPFIETPQGLEPPSLTAGNLAEWDVHEIENPGDFRVGPTYTFAFGSRFCDIINWRLTGLPFVTPLDFDKIIGRPPVHAVLYSLPEMPGSKEECAGGDARHLQSRKQYYFKAAIWSSLRRPARSRFEALTGAVFGSSADGTLSLASEKCKKKQKSMGRRLGRFGSKIRDAASDSVYCCVARTKIREMERTP